MATVKVISSHEPVSTFDVLILPLERARAGVLREANLADDAREVQEVMNFWNVEAVAGNLVIRPRSRRRFSLSPNSRR